MSTNTYNTISVPSEGLFKDKGSKFIAYAYPIVDIDSIKLFVDTLKKEHQTARHHCWAYRFGISGEQYRAYDDGEPSNTAGKPILGQIDSFKLTNILIVVVRYFGGTLLGVGGLIQAYREAAKDAILNAKIIEKEEDFPIRINCNYEDVDSILQTLKQNNSTIKSQDFNSSCEINCNATADVISLLQIIQNNKPTVSITIE